MKKKPIDWTVYISGVFLVAVLTVYVLESVKTDSVSTKASVEACDKAYVSQ